MRKDQLEFLAKDLNYRFVWRTAINVNQKQIHKRERGGEREGWGRKRKERESPWEFEMNQSRS